MKGYVVEGAAEIGQEQGFPEPNRFKEGRCTDNHITSWQVIEQNKTGKSISTNRVGGSDGLRTQGGRVGSLPWHCDHKRDDVQPGRQDPHVAKSCTQAKGFPHGLEGRDDGSQEVGRRPTPLRDEMGAR